MAQSCAEYVTKKDWDYIKQHMRPDPRNMVSDPDYRERLVGQLAGLVLEEAIKAIDAEIAERKKTQKITGVGKPETTQQKGDRGELVAAHVAVNVLRATDEKYEKPYHGIDGIFRQPRRPEEKRGQLVLVEAKNVKLTTERGQMSGSGPKKELSKTWVEFHATRLTKSGVKENVRLGREILEVGVDHTRRILIQLHPTSHFVKAYEMVSEGVWKPLDF